MKIAIFGTGGIGGYFGGRLAANGSDVTFIARGAHLAALKSDGLKLQSALGDLHQKPVKASDDPKSVGPVDYVLFCVKMYDVESAAAACKPLVGANTTVVTTQNGVDTWERIAPILGEARVMGGVAQIAATIAAPGTIRHTGKLARIVFGDRGGAVSARAKALEEVCKAAGIDALATDRIDVEIWQKFVFLASIAGLASMTRRSMGTINADPDLRALLGEAVGEVVAVARAKGVDLGGGAAERVTQAIGAMPGEAKPSMLQDLERGNRIEVAGLSGKVAALGRELGVPTPVHRTIYACLKPYIAGAPKA
jgi:2-dehydropantoate 2-reductase